MRRTAVFYRLIADIVRADVPRVESLDRSRSHQAPADDLKACPRGGGVLLILEARKSGGTEQIQSPETERPPESAIGYRIGTCSVAPVHPVEAASRRRV